MNNRHSMLEIGFCESAENSLVQILRHVIADATATAITTNTKINRVYANINTATTTNTTCSVDCP